MPGPKQLADLNLYRDDQGNVEISLARARGILAELDDKAGMYQPGQPIHYADVLVLEAADRLRVRMGRSIPMVLHCPRCGMQHVDAPGPGWTNPPHRSHQCQNEGCGTIWRPSDLPTVGVVAIQTTGKADNWVSAGVCSGRTDTVDNLHPDRPRESLNMCAHGADRGTYCGQCQGYSQGYGMRVGWPTNTDIPEPSYPAERCTSLAAASEPRQCGHGVVGDCHDCQVEGFL